VLVAMSRGCAIVLYVGALWVGDMSWSAVLQPAFGLRHCGDVFNKLSVLSQAWAEKQTTAAGMRSISCLGRPASPCVPCRLCQLDWDWALQNSHVFACLGHIT